MSLADDIRRQSTTQNPDVANSIAGSLKTHLGRVHDYYRWSPGYPNSAPHWRKLEEEHFAHWIELTARDWRRQEGGRQTPWTRTREWPDYFITLSFVPFAVAGEIRDAFAYRDISIGVMLKRSAYLDELEMEGFFDAPSRGKPAAGVVFGVSLPTSAVAIHLTWFPPADQKPYVIVVAQDILTPAERVSLQLG